MTKFYWSGKTTVELPVDIDVDYYITPDGEDVDIHKVSFKGVDLELSGHDLDYIIDCCRDDWYDACGDADWDEPEPEKPGEYEF